MARVKSTYADLTPEQRAGQVILRRNGRDGPVNEAGEYCYSCYGPKGQKIMTDVHVRDLQSWLWANEVDMAAEKCAFPIPHLEYGSWVFLSEKQRGEFFRALAYHLSGGGKLGR